MIYTIEIRRNHKTVCSISDHFSDDGKAISDARNELTKAKADEALVYRFGLLSRDRIATLTPR